MCAFLRIVVTRRASYHDGLGVDHFAHHATGRVGRHDQNLVQVQLLRGDSLQTAEKGVGGGVRAGEEHTEPTQICGEEGVHEARSGKREAEDRIGTGVTRQESESKHLANDQDRNLHPLQGPNEGVFPLYRAQFENQPGQNCRDEHAGSSG